MNNRRKEELPYRRKKRYKKDWFNYLWNHDNRSQIDE